MQTLSQGNTYKITYSIKNKDGSDKDLSGSIELKYALAVRKEETPLIELTLSDAELNITDPLTGKVEVTLTSDNLNTLSEGRYYHELWQVNALGDPTTLMGENLFISSKLIKE